MSRLLARARFLGSWALAVGLVLAVLPRAVDVSWHGVWPVLGALHWPTALLLLALWLGGLWVHTFVLTAAAPSLTHRRALTLNLTGSAVSNVVPLGGAAGVELNRRMMRAWGIDARAFTGYTFLTNLWDVGSKLLLPIVGVAVLARAGEHVAAPVRTAAVVAAVAFVGLVAGAAAVLASPRGAQVLGGLAERGVAGARRVLRRPGTTSITPHLLEVREQCADVVARGWLRMSLGIAGYVALQALLLDLCVRITGGGNTAAEVLAAFAVERLLTVVPLTPGGVGVADLGLVGTLIALGGDPAGAAAAAVVYRAFVFAVEIPVGSGALGLWLLGQRRSARLPLAAPARPAHRVAHVTDVFLPRLGGIETHVDDLVRHQRAAGLDAVVLTPSVAGGPADPAWVRRLRTTEARRAVAGVDQVHVHLSMFSPYGLAVAHAAVRAGVPVLVTVHSMWSGAGVLLRLAGLAGLRRWPVAWSAVSRPAADVFGRSLGVEVAVLPNAIDTADWHRGAAPDGPTSPTVVSVMRLMPRKRPVALVRVFAEVRERSGRDDLRLVVVGDGPLRHRVERAVRHHGLADHVRLTGRLDRADVLGELAAATVYVAPAPKESFGLAALEARCAGLPVVADRRSGVGTFVRDRVDGLLVDGDPGLVAALCELVADDDLRARITRHNRASVPPLSWEHLLGRTAEQYELAAAVVPVRTPVTAAPALAPVAPPVVLGA